MTYREAIVPACLQMFVEGKISLNEFSWWGFLYTSKRLDDETVEALARKLSGENIPLNRDIFAQEVSKAIPIAEAYANSPLIKALS